MLHSQLRASLSPVCGFPNFPGSSWLTDYTQPEKRAEREQALQRYFDELVLMPEALVAQQFHELLLLPASVAAVVCKVAARAFAKVQLFEIIPSGERASEKLASHRRLMHQRERAQRKQTARWNAEYEHAQTFHCSSVADDLDQRPGPLIFADPIGFRLRTTKHDFSIIRGLDGRPWFHVKLISLQRHSRSRWVICNVSGDPLMELHQSNKWQKYKYKVFAHIDREGTLVRVGEIQRPRVRHLATAHC